MNKYQEFDEKTI